MQEAKLRSMPEGFCSKMSVGNWAGLWAVTVLRSLRTQTVEHITDCKTTLVAVAELSPWKAVHLNLSLHYQYLKQKWAP